MIRAGERKSEPKTKVRFSKFCFFGRLSLSRVLKNSLVWEDIKMAFTFISHYTAIETNNKKDQINPLTYLWQFMCFYSFWGEGGIMSCIANFKNPFVIFDNYLTCVFKIMLVISELWLGYRFLFSVGPYLKCMCALYDS